MDGYEQYFMSEIKKCAGLLGDATDDRRLSLPSYRIDGSLEMAIHIIDNMEKVNSAPLGSQITRLCRYLLEALKHKINCLGKPRFYRQLKIGAIDIVQPSNMSAIDTVQPSHIRPAMDMLYNACGYFAFSHISAHATISAAMANEELVHIIDFQVFNATHWISFISSFNRFTRHGNLRTLKLTLIDHEFCCLSRGNQQSNLHVLFNVAQNNLIPIHITLLQMNPFIFQQLPLEGGEALAIHLPYFLNSLPNDAVLSQFLATIKSFTPKIVTLVEAECTYDGSCFYNTFNNSMLYFLKIIDCLAFTPWENGIQHSIAENGWIQTHLSSIINPLPNNVRRHQHFGAWFTKFSLAGFSMHLLNPLETHQIRITMAQSFSPFYTLLEQHSNARVLNWRDQPLSTFSAWH